MRAARWHGREPALKLEAVPVPVPAGTEVLVAVAAAGVCHSDVSIVDGKHPATPPLTLGHEIGGTIAAAGPLARGIEVGASVVVMPATGCGACPACRAGDEKLCSAVKVAGVHCDGGFAEYVLVAHPRQAVPLGNLDPVAATPLGCAGVIAYAAVRRALPHAGGGRGTVVLGAGGLGQYAVQIARLLVGGPVVAVDPEPAKRAIALRLGADRAVASAGAARDTLAAMTGREGADAVIDFVGTDTTLRDGAQLVGTRGALVVVGLAGGELRWSFGALAPEASVTTVMAANARDLDDVVALARAGRLSLAAERYQFAQVNDALADLRAGRVQTRAVIETALRPPPTHPTRRSDGDA